MKWLFKRLIISKMYYKTLFLAVLILFSLEACNYYSHSKQKYERFPQQYGKAMPKAKLVIDVGNDSSRTSYKVDSSAAPFTIIVKENDMKNDSLISLVRKLIEIVESNNTSKGSTQVAEVPAGESDFRFVLYILGVALTVVSRFISPSTAVQIKSWLPYVAQIITHAIKLYPKAKAKSNPPKENKPKQNDEV
jgi:hypothetical protein